MKWVDETIEGEIDAKQFGGISGTSTTDVLVELVHMWYKATDKWNSYVRVVMLDFSKAFELINHHLLLDKLQSYGLPAHILRWMTTFLLDRAQRVKIGNEYSHSGHPNGEVLQRTLSGSKCFLVYINYLRTTVPLYQYVIWHGTNTWIILWKIIRHKMVKHYPACVTCYNKHVDNIVKKGW